MECTEQNPQGNTAGDWIQNIILAIIIFVFIKLIYKGLTFMMRETWIKVLGTIGLLGLCVTWVYHANNKPFEHKQLQSVTVKIRKANVRYAPTTKNNVPIGTAKHGTKLQVVDTKGKWVKVKDGNGLSGWIHKSIVHKDYATVTTTQYPTSDIDLAFWCFGLLYLSMVFVGVVFWCREDY